MTQTRFVEFRDRGFWAYDVALGVLLKHVIDAAEERHIDGAWLSDAVSWWRVIATASDHGFTIDASWSDAQVATLIDLVEEACARLSERESISAEEIGSWSILEHEGVFVRGVPEVRTAPVVELGRAIVALAQGELPVAPPGSAWFYGTPSGRRTLPTRR